MCIRDRTYILADNSKFEKVTAATVLPLEKASVITDQLSDKSYLEHTIIKMCIRDSYDIAIEGQPKEQIYYHRSIQDIFNLCFRAGFVIDGFYEECFKTNKEIIMVMIVRLKKVKRDSLK